MLEEKERQRQIKAAMEQKGDMLKNRERVLSACGIRPAQNLCTFHLIKMSHQELQWQTKMIKELNKSIISI